MFITRIAELCREKMEYLRLTREGKVFTWRVGYSLPVHVSLFVLDPVTKALIKGAAQKSSLWNSKYRVTKLESKKNNTIHKSQVSSDVVGWAVNTSASPQSLCRRNGFLSPLRGQRKLCPCQTTDPVLQLRARTQTEIVRQFAYLWPHVKQQVKTVESNLGSRPRHIPNLLLDYKRTFRAIVSITL